MVNIIKGIFKTRQNNESENNDYQDNYTNYKDFVSKDWKDEGWKSARNLKGSESGLKVCIARIFNNHKETLRRDNIEQENGKRPLKVKYQEYISKNEAYEKKIEKIKDEDIPKSDQKIEKINNDIREIKENPDQYTGDRVGKVGFIIGSIILIFLTIYLFIFYSSASYSAFFKVFKPNELGIAASIFDAQALSKGYYDGVTELILLLTIPFVFLGLGYLIHKFLEEKKWTKYLKVSSFVFVTFIFDVILAYEILHKIHEMIAQDSFEIMEKYNFELAFSDVRFWLIIFAGFVVYIIWGFVFNFIMEAYEKLDKISILIKSKREMIRETEKQLDNFEDEINKLTYLIGHNKTEAEKLRTILDNTIIIKPKELETTVNHFTEGWLEWLTSDRREETEKEKATIFVTQYVEINIKSSELNLHEKQA